MQVLINVPDTLPNALIQERVKELEESLKKEAEKFKQKPSKWALLAERVANNPVHLEGYSEHTKRICRNLEKTPSFKMIYLLDSNTISDFYDKGSVNHPKILNKIAKLKDTDNVAISVLTLYELEYGLANAPDNKILWLVLC